MQSLPLAAQPLSEMRFAPEGIVAIPLGSCFQPGFPAGSLEPIRVELSCSEGLPDLAFLGHNHLDSRTCSQLDAKVPQQLLWDGRASGEIRGFEFRTVRVQVEWLPWTRAVQGKDKDMNHNRKKTHFFFLEFPQAAVEPLTEVKHLLLSPEKQRSENVPVRVFLILRPRGLQRRDTGQEGRKIPTASAGNEQPAKS